MQTQLERFLIRPIRGIKAYSLLFIVSALFVAPILFAGVDYIDDTSRKLEGAYQWGDLGRIVTEALMHMLTFNFGSMTDPGNLMQVLAIPFLALTAYVIAKAVGDGKQMTVLDLFIGMQVIPNQLLLTNLSFRFDSLSMILGNLLAVCAAYVLLQKQTKGYKSFIIATLLVFVSAGLYQSTILMFGVVVVVAFVMRYATRSSEKLYPVVAKAVGVLASGLVLYAIMLKLLPFKELMGQRKELVLFNVDGLVAAFHNFKAGIKTVLLFITNAEAFVLALLVMAALCISLALLIYSYARKRNIFDTILVSLSPLLITALIMGPFVLIQTSSLTTQVRVLTSVIGVMLLTTAATVALYKSGRRWALWLLAIPLLMNAYSISFAYVYGSTLKAQRAFDETVYQSLVTTIENDPHLWDSSTIFIGGEPASPETVETQFSKRPSLKRMDIAGDNSRWYIGNRLKDEVIDGFSELYNGRYGGKTAVDTICEDSLKPTVENRLYTVYAAQEGVYVIWLKDPVKHTGNLCTEI